MKKSFGKIYQGTRWRSMSTGIMLMFVVLICVILLITTGCSQAQPATVTQTVTSSITKITSSPPSTQATSITVKPIELSFSSMFNPVSEQHIYLEEWAEKIKTASNGRLTIRIYPSGTLVSTPESYGGVAKGSCDLATGFKYAYDKDLGMAVPVFMAGVEDAVTASKIYTDIYNGFPEYKSEWSDVKVFWLSSAGPNHIHLAKKEVRTLEDLKGMQIRVTGKLQAQSLVALGTAPVNIATSDLVSAMQKGTVDGSVGSDDQLTSYKLADVSPYTIDFGVFSSQHCFVAININKYNSLPADLQKVLDDSCEWGRNASSEAWLKGNQDGVDYAATVNHTFIKLSSDEKQRWINVLLNEQQKIAKDLDAKGLPGTKLLNMIQERLNYYSTGK